MCVCHDYDKIDKLIFSFLPSFMESLMYFFPFNSNASTTEKGRVKLWSFPLLSIPVFLFIERMFTVCIRKTVFEIPQGNFTVFPVLIFFFFSSLYV